MKHVIIIYGNIAAGKSTVAKALSKHLKDYRICNLDEYRIYVEDHLRFNNLIDRDHKAEYLCRKAMIESDKIIYETTAVTKYFELMKRELKARGYKLSYVYLNISIEESLDRYFKRRYEQNYKEAEFAFSGKYSLLDGIKRFDKKQRVIKKDLVFQSSDNTDRIISEILQSHIFSAVVSS